MIDWVPNTLGAELSLLGIAFVLSATIGAERQWHRKSAGLRTHTLVGVGSAIFTLVSAYGFSHINDEGVLLDPSRIAAQVVSGVGFLGAGVIFVHRRSVSGLTTAASIWMAAAIGMASGAGMPVIAIIGTALHLLTTTLMSKLAKVVRFHSEDTIVIQYKGGRDVLSAVLATATEMGFRTALTSARTIESQGKPDRIEVVLNFNTGRASLQRLIQKVSEVRGVVSVALSEDDAD